jgi:cell shape-determining protein MreC
VLLLTGVPYQVELARGTGVVTSGLGGIFPRGVPIGRVLDLVRAEEGWSKTYRLQPAVPPGAAVEVLVMRGANAAAPDDLWRADTVEAAGPSGEVR